MGSVGPSTSPEMFASGMQAAGLAQVFSCARKSFAVHWHWAAGRVFACAAVATAIRLMLMRLPTTSPDGQGTADRWGIGRGCSR